jgi:hypothetical protein
MPAPRLLSVGAVLLATLGCRAVHWSRPGATEQDFYRTKRACEASLGSSFCWGTARIDQAAIRNRQWQDCMRAHPPADVAAVGPTQAEAMEAGEDG